MRRQRPFLSPCGTPSGGSISYSQLQNTTQNIIRIVEKDGRTDRHADRQDETKQNGRTDRQIHLYKQTDYGQICTDIQCMDRVSTTSI